MAFRITGGNTNARQPLERITVALWVHCQVPDVAPVAAGFAPAQRHSLQREGPPSPLVDRVLLCGLDAAAPAALDLLLHGDRSQATSIYCADSARLAVCHNARTSGNRVL